MNLDDYVVINLEKATITQLIKGFDYLIGTFSSGEEDYRIWLLALCFPACLRLKPDGASLDAHDSHLKIGTFVS